MPMKRRRKLGILTTAWRSACLTAAVAIALPFGMSSALAGIDDAVAAYGRGDFNTAFAEFSRLAKSGDAEGQYSLGLLYAEGQGVKQDDEAAAKWYKAAAEQHYASAQYSLGEAYRLGHGVKRDAAAAAKWYKAASTQGHTPAQYRLGLLYDEGDGVPHDAPEAARWFTAAANGGHSEAQRQLAALGKP